APAEETSPADNGSANQEETSEDAAETDEASGDDEVYSIIEAVESEHNNGFIIDIDREDDGSTYEVDVVVDSEVHQLDEIGRASCREREGRGEGGREVKRRERRS